MEKENSYKVFRLGITIYITRSDESDIEDFEKIGMSTCVAGTTGKHVDTVPTELALESGDVETAIRIRRWLTKRVVPGKLTQGDKHVLYFLQGCQAVLNESSTRGKGMAVSFCGPTGLSSVVSRAIELCGGDNEIEYTSDHI